MTDRRSLTGKSIAPRYFFFSVSFDLMLKTCFVLALRCLCTAGISSRRYLCKSARPARWNAVRKRHGSFCPRNRYRFGSNSHTCSLYVPQFASIGTSSDDLSALDRGSTQVPVVPMSVTQDSVSASRAKEPSTSAYLGKLKPSWILLARPSNGITSPEGRSIARIGSVRRLNLPSLFGVEKKAAEPGFLLSSSSRYATPR